MANEMKMPSETSSSTEPSNPGGLTRRDFLKIGGGAAALGAVAVAAGNARIAQTGALQDQAADRLEETIVKTVCAMCPSGCGLDVRVVAGRAVKVEGSAVHPLNQGVCCLRGQASLEMLYSPERIQRPRLQLGEKGSGDWKEISWEEALQLVSEKLSGLRAAGQAHQVAFVHGDLRGQQRQLLQRFMRYYGSPNLIGRDSLGEQATRQAMYLTQGINGLPVYDLNSSNYVMAFGGNLLESSRNVIGYLASLAFMRRGRPRRGKFVAVHPRLSLTGIKADEWVPIRPGTYAALALGMANVMINSQLYNVDFVNNFTYGFEDFEDAEGRLHKGFKSLVLEQYTLERVAQITGVASEIIARLAGEFATNQPAVALLPSEPGELSSGNSLYTAMAVHALNALVGSIDVAGGVLVQRFPEMAEWPEVALDGIAESGLHQPRLDGAGSAALPLALSAYQEFPQHILIDDPYPIQALFLLNANPVYDLPDGGLTAQALLKVPFVVSFAPTLDESAAHADLILPASSFLEVWGDDYLEGTGYAGVSLRRPVVERVHDTRDPGDFILELAARLGGSLAQALPWSDYFSLVKQRLGGIDLDWDKFETNGFWSELIYFNAAPGSLAWTQVVGRDRINAPQDGRYDFFSRELHALLGAGEDAACLPHFELPATLTNTGADAAEYPYLLVSQGLITHATGWQGMIPTLQEAYGLQGHVKWSSWVELNPRTAEALHVEDGEWVWVESRRGRVKAPVRVYAGLWPNAVYMPAGMGHHTGVRWGRGADNQTIVGANPALLAEFGTEALNGQAVFNPVRVRITKA